MKRREFLKLGGSGLALGMSMSMAPRALKAAMGTTGFPGRTLVNMMLLGGADLRYLLVPAPGTDYADKFWQKRKALYQYGPNSASLTSYDVVWNTLYLPVTSNGVTFGIHKNAAWLRDQFLADNVAIISNVLGSSNRRHDHSQLIVNTGDPNASQFVYDRDGWGGRLAYAIATRVNGEANTCAVTNDISVFCNGIDPANRNARVVHVRDSRNFGLSSGNGVIDSPQSSTARALKAYYAQKRLELNNYPQDWPFRRFFQHEQSLRQFGDAFNARLAQVAPQQPAALQALYTAGSGNTLDSPYFGKQVANIYDSFLAADLFRMRILSVEYPGWDTHKNERAIFEAQIGDIFGTGKGLDTLTQLLEPLGANDQLVYTLNSDFGRQLAANGSNGSDHGSGTYSIVIGRSVQGGVYGEMFPVSEIPRFDQQGADIEGKTDLQPVLAEVCDWVQAGTGQVVFPYGGKVEPGVDLSQLFI